jgi:uncharacterized protein YkwD
LRPILAIVPLFLLACGPGPQARSGPDARLGSKTPDSLEGAVAREINLLRADPRAYAQQLRDLRARYEGKLLHLDGRDPIRTREGVKPLDEAIRLLEHTKPLPALRWEPGLAHAAEDHAADIGARGVLDHFGAKGESPLDRVARYGVLQGPGGENIAVAFSDAHLIVVYLLIDDGVPDRGHREALVDRRYEQVGVGCGDHARFKTVCVMDFAAGYASLVR